MGRTNDWINRVDRLKKGLTEVAEENGKEEETMQCTKQNDASVHSEVEDLEKLRLGKGKHGNSTKFRQSYTA